MTPIIGAARRIWDLKKVRIAVATVLTAIAAAILLPLARKAGLPLSEDTISSLILGILGVGGATTVAQGVADHGKEAALINAQAMADDVSSFQAGVKHGVEQATGGNILDMAKGLGDKATAILLALTLGLLVTTQTACNDPDVQAALADSVSFGQQLASTFAQQLPADDPRVAEISKWVETAAKFQKDFAANHTPQESINLVITAAEVTETFQRQIVPLLQLNPTVKLAIIGIDAGLRVASHYLVKQAAKVKPAQAHADPRLQKALDQLNKFLESKPLQ